MSYRFLSSVLGALLVGLAGSASAQERIPNLVDQVDLAKTNYGPEGSVYELIVANPLGRVALQQAEAALSAGTLHPDDHAALRNAQLIAHPGDGLTFTGIVKLDENEPILVFPNGTKLPDGSEIAPGGHLKLVADQAYSWQDQRVRETTAFLGEVTSVRGYLGPNNTITVREFAPGASHHFVTGRVWVDDEDRTVIRMANGDKEVIVDNEELAGRLRRFLEAKDDGGDIVGGPSPRNYMVIMPGFVESTLKPDGTVDEYHFKGMPDKIWLLNRLGRIGGRTNPNLSGVTPTGPTNGVKMKNGFWMFDIQTPMNIGTLAVVDDYPENAGHHPFPNTSAGERHFMLGMIPGEKERLPLDRDDINGDRIKGYRDIVKYVRRFNATGLEGAAAMSHDVVGRTSAGTSIDRDAPINRPMLVDDGRRIGFEARIPEDGFNRQKK